ncbi:DEKNAAC104695 [Brettanomyces naardenensis]|uniref:Actin-like protein ARP6 n=1 Tax=Brettanomyces naardenensis TaxID=13370 RepID=A0A448YR75_BRENA|nr:DEKNAAC104695 [Brettanomyces naardenensis]
MTDEVLFEEFNIGSLYRCSSGSLTPWLTSNKDKKYKDFQLVIDSGFDSTWVIPMIYGLPHWEGVRKMPIAGRALNGYMREMISFRHYNVTDEMVLVNNIKEKTCYVTSDYESSLKKVEKLRKSKGMKDHEGISINYVLPDYKTTNIGYTMTDEELGKFQQQETVQSLKLYDERFAIPELLFHPELGGLHKAGIIPVIKESLSRIPSLIRPLMVANIVLMGGTFNLPGFKERLIQDLKQEIPIDNEIEVHNFDRPDYSEIGWYAGQQFFARGGFQQVCVSKEEYQELGVEYTQEKFGYKLHL